MERVYIGIDPGVNGAGALITGGAIIIKDFNDLNMLTLLKQYAYDQWRFKILATVERVSASPQMGVTSAFTFGQNFGSWIGYLTALDIPFTFVSPLTWQKEMLKGQPRLTKVVTRKGVKKEMTDTKTMSLNVARQLFPVVSHLLTRKKDSDRADALLIAEFCRRKDKGVL